MTTVLAESIEIAPARKAPKTPKAQAAAKAPAEAQTASAAPAEPEAPTAPATEIEILPLGPANHRDVVNRLKRIEGQVRGLIDMVEKGRGCEDVAQQMAAARKAMDKAFYRMMTSSVMEAVAIKDTELSTFREVERSTRILEKYA